MTENKAKIIDLLNEAKKYKIPDDKERRLSHRYLFLVLTLFAVFVIVMLLAYVRLQKDHRGLQQTLHQKVSHSLQRAEELEGEKKYVAAKEM